MKETGGAMSFDDAMDALADVQRRKLLVALLEHNPQDDAPVVIAGSASESDALERLVTMEHVHLPKLDDYDELNAPGVCALALTDRGGASTSYMNGQSWD